MALIPNLRRLVLFILPPLALVLAIMPHPGAMSQQAWIVIVISCVMAIWWMTEIVPLAVTALIPLICFPLLEIRTVEDTATSYAHPLIFLFLGGFLLAQAMARWGLHRRLAINIIRIGGNSPDTTVAGLMIATAFLSLWISNTATAMVMLPIGQSIANSLSESNVEAGAAIRSRIGTTLMLGIGYAATIGGMGSLIGTPANAILAGLMKETYGVDIGFAQWMLFAMPVVLILLPATWWILTRLVFPISRRQTQPCDIQLEIQGENLGPMSTGEKRIAILMVSVALLWMFRPVLSTLLPGLHLTDPGIAITAAVLLFVIPIDIEKNEFLLGWKDAAKIRWDILILFGGGLALAGGIDSSGLANWIGETSITWRLLPPLALLAVVTVLIVYLGELASNTAMAAVFLPVTGAIAVGMGEDPLQLMLPVTLAASLGFMLPVATPPNAIVFGSGALTANQMLRAGALLDIVGIVVVVIVGSFIVPIVFPEN